MVELFRDRADFAIADLAAIHNFDGVELLFERPTSSALPARLSPKNWTPPKAASPAHAIDDDTVTQLLYALYGTTEAVFWPATDAGEFERLVLAIWSQQ